MKPLTRKFLFQKDPYILVPEKRAVRRSLMQAGAFSSDLKDNILYLFFKDLEEKTLSRKDATYLLTHKPIPLGSVEFCLTYFDFLGIKPPKIETYPEVLQPFFFRKIWKAKCSDVPPNFFIKPSTQVKAFTGHIKTGIPPQPGVTLPAGDPYPPNFDDLEVYAATPVKWLSEARYYVLNSEILGHSRYDAEDNPLENPEPNIASVKAATALLKPTNPPCAFCLDFGVLNSGETALVEYNDAWAIGYYPWGTMTEENYVNFIEARWLEIISNN